MPYTISPVTPETFPAVLALVADYQRFYGRTPDEERNRAFFGELLGAETHGLQLVAYAEREAIGFATLYWNRSSTLAATVALLNDLYVVPEHRGGREHGVGTALMRAAADAAADRGYSLMSWETAPDNDAGQALYDRFLKSAKEPGSKSSWIHYGYPLPRAT